MAVGTPKVNDLKETGLDLLAATNILENVSGVGTAPEGDQFVNTKDTYLVIYATADHEDDIVITVAKPATSLYVEGFGNITLSDLTWTISDPVVAGIPQMKQIKIPVRFNDANGKALVKVTSATEFTAGEVKIGVFKGVV